MAAHDGHDSSEGITLDYLSFRWRREMGYTHQTFRETDLRVVKRDLEYLSIERTVERAKASQE